MKKQFFFLLFFSSFLFSQKGHRFFYELKFKIDSTSHDFTKDFYCLDILEKEQKFYNYEYLKNDSISKSKTNKEIIFSYPKLSIRIIHNDTGFSNYFSQTPLYYQINTNERIKWEITSEKKEYESFIVQKAIAKFGGRNWIAWFTVQLPFNYGPYKFFGLPGLILEIYDDKENYIFSFKGNKNIKKVLDTTNFLETENGIKPISVTQDRWKKLQLDYYINPLKDFGEGGLIVEDENGVKVQANSREIIQGQQSYLRKNNNPIEVDQAVNYPPK